MKAIIFTLGLLFVTNSYAQKFDCTSTTNAYQELLKTDKITESFPIWSDVLKNCPKQKEAIYTDGIRILTYKMEMASLDEKEKEVRNLMKLYDQYYKNFPLSIPDFEIKKAMLLLNNTIDAKDEIFTLLNAAFSKSKHK